MAMFRRTAAFRDFLNGNKPVARTDYADWRQTVPWTDEQIVAALREASVDCSKWAHRKFEAVQAASNADHLERTGRLTSEILGRALPFLVRCCSICGKKALYRFGNEGRCSTHRDVQHDYNQTREQRRDARSADVLESRKASDNRLLQGMSARGSRKFGKR